jgi:hypothetical protein
MFTRKTHSQLAHSVSTPPRNTPAVPPAAAAVPYTANALVRSFGSCAKRIRSSMSAAGAMSAAPTP